MTAGISPIKFWDMTIDEISCEIYGFQQRIKFQATLTYMLPMLINKAIGNNSYPQPDEVFPGLLDAPQQKSQWEIMKERVLAHSEDYKRNRGEKT